MGYEEHMCLQTHPEVGSLIPAVEYTIYVSRSSVQKMRGNSAAIVV